MTTATLTARPVRRRAQAIAKRFLDVTAAGMGLVLLSPLFLLTALAIRLDSAGPVFYRQRRIGRGMRPFSIYKFRTMTHNPSQSGRLITVSEDPRITRLGRILRKTKIDELPQLINVVKGDMSLVGPRPEVPRYVEMFRPDFEEILTVRPGITDLGSLHYCDESTVLSEAENPELEYVNHVLPHKILMAKEYLTRGSLLFDLTLILKTVGEVVWYRAASNAATAAANPQGNSALKGAE